MKLTKYNRISMTVSLLVFSCLSCKKESIYQHKSKPEVTVAAGDFRLYQSTIHLSKDTVYILASNLVRDSGQSLIIDAGTLVKVNDKISITIKSGAVIDA